MTNVMTMTMNDATMVAANDELIAWNMDGDIQLIAHADGRIDVEHDGELIVDGIADDEWSATECAEYANELIAEASYLIAQEA